MHSKSLLLIAVFWSGSVMAQDQDPNAELEVLSEASPVELVDESVDSPDDGPEEAGPEDEASAVPRVDETDMDIDAAIQEAAAAAAAAGDLGDTGDDLETFDPSEKISEDRSVAFPNDI